MSLGGRFVAQLALTAFAVTALFTAVGHGLGLDGVTVRAVAIAAAASALTTSLVVALHVRRDVLTIIRGLVRDLERLRRGEVQSVTVQAQRQDLLRELGDTLNAVLADTRERDERQTQSSAYVHAILDAIPGHVSWVSSDLRYLGVNENLARTHKLKPADYIGREVGFLGDGPLRGFLEHFFTDPALHAQFEINGRKGERFLVSAQKYNENRDCVLVGIDVTERARLIAQVEAERQRAQFAQKMSVLGEMAGGIAHEINNPVAIIYGKARLLTLLADRPDQAKRVADAAKSIEETAMRIARIVQGLRSFARDGDRDPFQTVSLAAVVDETLALCETRLKHQGVSVEVRLPEDKALTFDCRPTQISQVLLNLISNANDAISRLTERWIRVEALDLGEEIELAVVDSGRGIPPDVAARIFHPFFTTKEVGKGTGLGLSISRGIAETHGGRLSLDTVSGHTRFAMRLPKRHLQTQAAPQGARAS